MSEDPHVLRARARNGETTVTVENVLTDLAKVDEATSTGQYGYFREDDGTLYADVWNETYHGVKRRYRVIVTLDEDTDWTD